MNTKTTKPSKQSTKSETTKASHPNSWLNGTPRDAKPAKAPKAPKASKPEPKAEAPKASKPKKPSVGVCICACGSETSGGLFRVGHDAKLHGQALRVWKGQMERAEMKALENPVAREWLMARAWMTPAIKEALGLK